MVVAAEKFFIFLNYFFWNLHLALAGNFTAPSAWPSSPVLARSIKAVPWCLACDLRVQYSRSSDLPLSSNAKVLMFVQTTHESPVSRKLNKIFRDFTCTSQI